MAPTPSDRSPSEPATTRYRCNACGNLTRFDVLESITTRSFHHYTVGGELTVEDPEVLEHEIREVSCRWCGNGSAVVGVTDEPIDGSADGDGPPGSTAG